MGKGGRNHSRKYRIEVHSEAYYRKQRELKHRREQAKAIRDGHIFADEASLELKIKLNPGGKMPMILALPKKKEPKGSTICPICDDWFSLHKDGIRCKEKEPDGVKC